MSVAFLQNERARAVQNPDLIGRNRGGVASRLEAITGSLTPQQFNARIVDESSEGADRVGSATHACNHDVGQAPLGGEKLSASLVADDAL